MLSGAGEVERVIISGADKRMPLPFFNALQGVIELGKLELEFLKEEEHETVLAIKYFCSKNCKVADDISSDLIHFLFNSKRDAEKARTKLRAFFRPDFSFSLVMKYWTDDKYGFSLDRAQMETIRQEAIRDFEEKEEKIRELLAQKKNPLSDRTKKYIQEQLGLIVDKKRNNTFSIADAIKFRNNIENLPMPIELKIAISAFLGAAFLFAAIPTIPAGVAAASTLAAVSAGSGSMWLFGRGRKGTDEKDQAEVKKELKS